MEGPVVYVQGLVEDVEDAGPGVRGIGRAAYGPRVEVAARAGGAAVRAAGLELVDGQADGPRGAERLDDGQGDDGLAGPAAPVVDVEREPGRQVDQLGRDDRQVVPGPQAGQGQPDPGEHPGRLDPALVGDPVAGQLHVRRVRLVAGQPQGQVGLHGGGQVGRAAVEVGPRAVLPLLGPDPAPRRGDHGVVVQAEELAQQQVLGVHGHVGLELALPPPVGVLQAEQVVAGPVEGPAGEIREQRVSYHVRAVMNSAIAVSSAWTSAARSMSARLALAAASWVSASVSAQSLPPAATTRSAARTRSASVSWKASPTCAPNLASAMASVGGAPRCTAPMLQAHAIRAAVLSPAISRHSARVTSSRFSKARSAPCPPISRSTAADRQRAAQAPLRVSSSSSRSWASARSPSPARMAAPTPNTVQAVGRCLRSVSLSMMSSCSREKLCTSSTATAAVTPRSGGAPAARAESRASAGRSALPPLPLPVGLPAASAK